MYVALDKGPICMEHFLILPKTHIGASIDLAESSKKEYLYIKQQLIKYLDKTKGKDYILFERHMELKYSNA